MLQPEDEVEGLGMVSRLSLTESQYQGQLERGLGAALAGGWMSGCKEGSS